MRKYCGIKEGKISEIADEQLEKEFGSLYSTSSALENQHASAAFYLQQLGYSRQEIQEKHRAGLSRSDKHRWEGTG